ncbi:MAG: hypothetical protein A3A82_00820 [Candidatus Pacebacteria bacterium RIFCSPLOWO2_01_FULL_47_12]|nr:MAG: hypothetical protein A3A82_00820 [Candidatus Pacebacteria bacterium RIFCSPLOWO2_01_FULL_47_12]
MNILSKVENPTYVEMVGNAYAALVAGQLAITQQKEKLVVELETELRRAMLPAIEEYLVETCGLNADDYILNLIVTEGNDGLQIRVKISVKREAVPDLNVFNAGKLRRHIMSLLLLRSFPELEISASVISNSVEFILLYKTSNN